MTRNKDIANVRSLIQSVHNSIVQRGNPALNDTVVHHWVCVDERNGRGLEPLWDASCRTGAYHIHVTMNEDLVTCPCCKEKLERK